MRERKKFPTNPFQKSWAQDFFQFLLRRRWPSDPTSRTRGGHYRFRVEAVPEASLHEEAASSSLTRRNFSRGRGRTSSSTGTSVERRTSAQETPRLLPKHRVQSYDSDRVLVSETAFKRRLRRRKLKKKKTHRRKLWAFCFSLTFAGFPELQLEQKTKTGTRTSSPLPLKNGNRKWIRIKMRASYLQNLEPRK